MRSSAHRLPADDLQSGSLNVALDASKARYVAEADALRASVGSSLRTVYGLSFLGFLLVVLALWSAAVTARGPPLAHASRSLEARARPGRSQLNSLSRSMEIVRRISLLVPRAVVLVPTRALRARARSR